MRASLFPLVSSDTKDIRFIGLFGDANPFAYRADTGSHKDLVCRSVCRNGLIAVDKVGYVPLAGVGADFPVAGHS